MQGFANLHKKDWMNFFSLHDDMKVLLHSHPLGKVFELSNESVERFIAHIHRRAKEGLPIVTLF